jgi:pre-mRNA-splicing factor CWC26
MISDSDQSPPRDQMSKTLGGKKAGLQDAKAMKEEMLKLKKKERDTFDKVQKESCGKYNH